LLGLGVVLELDRAPLPSGVGTLAEPRVVFAAAPSPIRVQGRIAPNAVGGGKVGVFECRLNDSRAAGAQLALRRFDGRDELALVCAGLDQEDVH